MRVVGRKNFRYKKTIYSHIKKESNGEEHSNGQR